MKVPCCAILLATLICVNASSQEYKRFYDLQCVETDSAHSYYYEVMSIAPSGMKYNSFYTRTNNRRSEGETADAKGFNRQTYYFEDGTKMTEGTFRHSTCSGLFKSYYPNGKLKSDLFFIDSQSLDGEDPVVMIISYWDSLGTQLVANGKGNCVCDLDPLSPDVMIEKGAVQDSLKVGPWEGFSTTSDYKFKEVYDRGVVKHGTLECEGKTYVYDDLMKSAVPEKGMESFYRAVGAEVKYPREARRRGIEGKVFVEFVVETNGSLTGIKVVKGIGAGCDEETVRVVSLSPRWKPGMQRGKPVKQRYTLPLIYRLR